MMRSFRAVAVLALLSSRIFAQGTPPPARAAASSESNQPQTTPTPEFEIADIHPSTSSDGPRFTGGFLLDGRYILHQATMADLIATAYGLKNSTYVQGGPSWLDWDHFDIVAKVPPGTTQETAKVMLQSLLADRFKLVVHHGDALVPAFLLTIASGKPNLKPASPTTDTGSCQRQDKPNAEPGPPPSSIQLVCHSASLSSLADTLNDDGAGGYLSYPVIDSTGLTGDYDFDLKWTPKFFLTRVGPSAASIFQALEQQLGLKLEFKTTPRPGLVVDSVDEKPTPNAPDLAKIMPPLPLPQFEVAVIRPTDPAERRGIGRISGDEVNLQNIPLKFLITFAWDLDPRDDSTLVAPKWIESDRVDIHAKIAASDLGVNSSGKPGSVDFYELRPMLRALLIDRFQIKFHMETRPADVYSLTAVHPNLTKADPSERTECKDGPGRDGKDPRMTNVMLNSLVTCQNMTMDQFSEMLTSMRGRSGYIFYPVINDTGLKGAWDFTTSWSSADLMRAAGPGSNPAPASGDLPTASEPNGAISYFEALQKQHGLKLAKVKRPEPVLVIDQISEKPTEN